MMLSGRRRHDEFVQFCSLQRPAAAASHTQRTNAASPSTSSPRSSHTLLNLHFVIPRTRFCHSVPGLRTRPPGATGNELRFDSTIDFYKLQRTELHTARLWSARDIFQPPDFRVCYFALVTRSSRNRYG